MHKRRLRKMKKQDELKANANEERERFFNPWVFEERERFFNSGESCKNSKKNTIKNR